MDSISQEQFDALVEMLPEEVKKEKSEKGVISEKDFNLLLEDMQNPVKAQKHLAVQVKMFLDFRINEEMEEKGCLSDHTRRWVESYNNILEKLQKAIHGDKSVNLHLHKVTHSQIAAKMRDAIIDEN